MNRTDSPSLRCASELAFRRLVAVGFRKWKAHNLRPILQGFAEHVLFVSALEDARRLDPTSSDALAIWGAEPPAGLEALAATSGAMLLRLEDGFIRSVGLGSDLIPPQSLVLDRRGIYFDATRPSELESILSNESFSEDTLTRAASVRQTIVDAGLTKYNIEARAAPDWAGRYPRIVLVIGQVESDSSIALGGTSVRTNLQLLEHVREACADATIVYKPHPDVMSGNRRGRANESAAMRIADVVETNCSIASCIEACDEVHTITSLAGFDALLRSKPVTTWGMPFYAGWGLTCDRMPNPAAAHRRCRMLSLDELVAGALLRYPIYWDETTRRQTNCESVLSNIAHQRNLLESTGKLDELRTGTLPRLSRKLRTLGHAWLGTRSRD